MLGKEGKISSQASEPSAVKPSTSCAAGVEAEGVAGELRPDLKSQPMQ